MKIIRNVGQERVVDLVRPSVSGFHTLDLATSHLSLHAFAELSGELARLRTCRLLLPPETVSLALLGSEADRAARNRLQTHWYASKLRQWVEERAEVRCAPGGVPQGAVVVRDGSEQPLLALMGSLAFSTDGLGLTPGNPMNLVQASETADEAALFGEWFAGQWSALRNGGDAKRALIEALQELAADRAPHQLYALILHHLFQDRADAMDEERIVRSATGIRDTTVWQKLYSFQRDGVVAAIDKLERYGGCIIADSVGLGKTFEALAVIKYHELRNDRVLVLCPKRLRDNWTLYAANDRRNVLARDRFNYDVLNQVVVQWWLLTLRDTEPDCSRGRRACGRSHAWSRTWRRRASCGQIGRAAGGL